MTNSKDVILKLKEVRDEKGLSYNDILDMMEANGDYLSKTTLSRVFAEGSEDIKFRYEDTIRPIANALLDMETIEEDDNPTVSGLKSVIKYKMDIISDLKQQVEHLQNALDKEKVKYHEKLEKERELSRRSLDFLKEQLSYKDKRMDEFMEAVKEKDAQINRLLDKLL